MRAAVRRVAKHFPTAIISGRSHDKVIFRLCLNDVMTYSLAIICLFIFQPSLRVLSEFDHSMSYALFFQVYEFVGLKELYYAGSHGMDIMGPVRQSTADDHRNGFRTTDKQVIDYKLYLSLMLSLTRTHT